MLATEQIEELIAYTVGVREQRHSEYEKKRYAHAYEATAEYYPNYNWMIRFKRAVSIHFDQRIVPSELFEMRAPNQTAEEAGWLQTNYKHITGPVAMDYINTVARCFIQGNFSIDYKDELESQNQAITGDTYRQYMENGFGPYDSAMNWARNFLPTIKAKDANGVIAIKPSKIPVTQNEDGEFVVDSTELPEVLPFYYSIEYLVGYQDNLYSLIELTEKSVVTVNDKPEKTGYVYELYDDTWIYKIIQVGVKKDENYEIVPYFQHDWGKVPTIKLMGVAGVDDNEIIYQSPFMLSTALLEQAILDDAYLSMIKAKTVFPHVIMLSSECEYEEVTEMGTHQCSGGKIHYTGENGEEYSKTCPNCHGQGVVSRMAPFGRMLIKPGDWENEGDASIQDPIRFVSPPLEAPKMLREEVDLNINKARGILHLNTTTGEAKGRENATATAKALDLKNLISFAAPISAQTWQIIRFVYEGVAVMRHDNTDLTPDITEPREFDFKTQSDILADIESATNAGLPAPIIHQLYVMYFKSAFHGETKSIKALNLISKADRLLTTPQDAVDMGVTRNEIASWEVVLHHSAVTFVSELLLDNPTLFDMPIEQQVEMLKNKAKEVQSEIQSENNSSLLGQITEDGDSTDPEEE